MAPGHPAQHLIQVVQGRSALAGSCTSRLPFPPALGSGDSRPALPEQRGLSEGQGVAGCTRLTRKEVSWGSRMLMRLLRPSSWACMPLQSVWKFAYATDSPHITRHCSEDSANCKQPTPLPPCNRGREGYEGFQANAGCITGEHLTLYSSERDFCGQAPPPASP